MPRHWTFILNISSTDYRYGEDSTPFACARRARHGSRLYPVWPLAFPRRIYIGINWTNEEIRSQTMSSSAHEAPPTSFSSLQFPIASQSLSHTTRLLHQFSQSTHNRLASICQDATFVTHIGSSLGLPIIANERCGGWYVPPESRAGSAYFKSTDGHFGEWAFSKRRLNLQLLDIIGKNQGCAT